MTEPSQSHRGKVALLDQANLDTDQIIPKQFLKSISRQGFADALFYNARFLPNGKLNPQFPLNHPAVAGASILLTRGNFGCGSSREHAVWALQQYGFRVIIAEERLQSPAFADIFRGNARKNGLLLIALPATDWNTLQRHWNQEPGFLLTVDLPNQTITVDSTPISFSIAPGEKRRLMLGLDEIGDSLQHEKQIIAYETQHFNRA